MAQVPILLYIVVVDEGEKIRPAANRYFRYTRPVLQNTLQLMGCKARHAFKISRRVFEVMTSDTTIDAWTLLGMEVSGLDGSNRHYEKEHSYSTSSCLGGEVGNHLVSEQDDRCGNKPFEFYNRCMTIVRRETFLDFVCGVLAEYKYVGPNQRADLVLACRVRERKESMTVLFCGTSGCGKSTLSALLGSRLGIKTVISTDSIRHMMRSFVDEKQNPLLWASTYHAGEYLDPVAVSEAKAKRNAMKVAHVLNLVPGNEVSDGNTDEKKPASHLPDVSLSTAELISAKKMVIEGFKAQSEMVRNSLDRLITAWEEQKESVVVEGVHLSLNFVMGLVRKHPSIIPFLIYIANEDKHLQRFAVRAKYMALDPRKNKYVKYIHNIRAIQEYLCKRADKHLVPKINNTNVDRSVAIIHATVFSCLRRRVMGENLYNSTTNTVSLIDEEYRNQCAADLLRSKGMFQLIQRKGSSQHLMALMKIDGSAEKAWPLNTVCGNGRSIFCRGSEVFIGNPIYGPLQISRAEPVHLQFGHYGISSWLNDIGGSSQTLGADDLSTDGSESGSRYHSSCRSSPRMSDGPTEELGEELLDLGCDEECDNPLDVDTNGNFSDVDDEQIHEEMEGSVDEESADSDEEYDDLAMQDVHEKGFLLDDAEYNVNLPVCGD